MLRSKPHIDRSAIASVTHPSFRLDPRKYSPIVDAPDLLTASVQCQTFAGELEAIGPHSGKGPGKQVAAVAKWPRGLRTNGNRGWGHRVGHVSQAASEASQHSNTGQQTSALMIWYRAGLSLTPTGQTAGNRNQIDSHLDRGEREKYAVKTAARNRTPGVALPFDPESIVTSHP